MSVFAAVQGAPFHVLRIPYRFSLIPRPSRPQLYRDLASVAMGKNFSLLQAPQPRLSLSHRLHCHSIPSYREPLHYSRSHFFLDLTPNGSLKRSFSQSVARRYQFESPQDPPTWWRRGSRFAVKNFKRALIIMGALSFLELLCNAIVNQTVIKPLKGLMDEERSLRRLSLQTTPVCMDLTARSNQLDEIQTRKVARMEKMEKYGIIWQTSPWPIQSPLGYWHDNRIRFTAWSLVLETFGWNSKAETLGWFPVAVSGPEDPRVWVMAKDFQENAAGAPASLQPQQEEFQQDMRRVAQLQLQQQQLQIQILQKQLDAQPQSTPTPQSPPSPPEKSSQRSSEE